jgi:hypothetical protein
LERAFVVGLAGRPRVLNSSSRRSSPSFFTPLSLSISPCLIRAHSALPLRPWGAYLFLMADYPFPIAPRSAGTLPELSEPCCLRCSKWLGRDLDLVCGKTGHKNCGRCSARHKLCDPVGPMALSRRMTNCCRCLASFTVLSMICWRAAGVGTRPPMRRPATSSAKICASGATGT